MLIKKILSVICIIVLFSVSCGLNIVSAAFLDEESKENIVENIEQKEEINENLEENENLNEENSIINEENTLNETIENEIVNDENQTENDVLNEEIENEDNVETSEEEITTLSIPKTISNEVSTKFEDGTYIIYSALGNRACLDVSAGSMENTGNIQIWEDYNVDQQKFKIKYVGDGCYTITCLKSSKLLDVAWGESFNGTNVHQYTSNGTDAQKFYFKCIEELSGKQSIENGVYYIKPNLSGSKVLEVKGSSKDNGANIQIWSNVNQNKQKFIVTYIGDGFYQIENIYSGKLLDVAGASKQNGTNVHQYESNGTDAQKWVIKDIGDGYYNIISRCGGLYLDVAYGLNNNGTNIQIYEKNGTNAQKFTFQKTDLTSKTRLKNGMYVISSKINKNKVLDIDAGRTDNCANLQIWDNSDVKQQKFIITDLNDGFYRITSVKSAKVLDVANGSTSNGANVWQYKSNNTRAQEWFIKDAGNGYYNIISRCGGLYLDIAYGIANNGSNVQMYEANGTDAQLFEFTKTETDGIDVSTFNGKVDWKKVANADTDFAFIRTAYRGYGTGKFANDDRFEENMKGCIENNINCGVYFVTQAINYEEGKEEALYVLDRIKGYKINCPIVIDVEDSAGDPGRADDLTKEERTEAIKGFCDTIKNNGYDPMIYTSKSWLKDKIDLSKLSTVYVWLAHYVAGAPEKLSDYTGDYLYWQYTSTGHVDGVSGYVDLNKGY